VSHDDAAEAESPTTHEPARQKFLSELWDAVSLRTVVMVVGVLLLQLGFILSYVGAFHSPKPYRIAIAVVAPASASTQIVSDLNAIASTRPGRSDGCGDSLVGQWSADGGDGRVDGNVTLTLH
jgi:hypothetical protein